MKRKRFIKLLMSKGFSRNFAEDIAYVVQSRRMSYFGYYHGTNLNKHEWINSNE